MGTIQEEIRALKKEKNAVILAHYYQTGDIIDIADMVGASSALAKQARDATADLIVFCGVRFMAESAKILNPERAVLLPAENAGCPMAEMVTGGDVLRLRAQHPDAAVACYVNTTAETKAECDICVTSSNAVKVIASLPQKQVVFVPDKTRAVLRGSAAREGDHSVRGAAPCTPGRAPPTRTRRKPRTRKRCCLRTPSARAR
jgi:quinolinate synthase